MRGEIRVTLSWVRLGLDGFLGPLRSSSIMVGHLQSTKLVILNWSSNIASYKVAIKLFYPKKYLESKFDRIKINIL